MTTPKRNSKRSVSTSSPLVSTAPSSINILNGLLDCYNFLSPNEYSDKTFGLLAFLLRKSVGEVNFSDLVDEVEKRNQQGEADVFIALLQCKRDSLSDIEASIEKCLMINRLITYIQDNEKLFMSIISHIRLDMKVKMTDNRVNQPIQYPNDFREREKDFSKRKDAQDMRRLFYLSHAEAKEPANLIYLKNRTTEHLNHLLDCRMRYEPAFRDIGLKEVFNIINTSFMIVAHPHCGVNPVIIYDRKGPGEYTAKVSVIIVSLLHDFMQTHPNVIELCDIEPSLWPLSPHYKLIEPRSLSWKTCQLYGCPGNKTQIIQYAELSFITIQQMSKKDTRVHFAQLLHSLKFAIKLHVHLREYRFSINHQIILESLPFGIGQHNNQIPILLTRVILDDIRRFLKSQSVDVKKISNFIQRYFIHRTGVKLKEYVGIYLEQELSKAKTERKNFQTLEDIFMDFLVPIVHQIEFMAKHPILAMFYADGLFLGICNSKRVGEVIMQPSDIILPRIGLRFNSIETDYNSVAMSAVSGRIIKLKACAIRVDIYNNSTNKIQHRTFNPCILPNDLSTFISTSASENVSHIHILSNFDDKTNGTIYKSFTEFRKYYHQRLRKITKTDGKYKLFTNIIDNINNGSDDDISNTDTANLCPLSSYSITSISPVASDHEHVENSPIPWNNNEALSVQQKNQTLIQHILSQPELVTELLRQMTQLNLISPIQEPQTEALYQNHHLQLPYEQQQPSSLTNLCQSETGSLNSICSNPQQHSISSDNFEFCEDTQSALDILEFMSTDEMLFIPNNSDFQLCLDELTNGILSSQNGQ